MRVIIAIVLAAAALAACTPESSGSDITGAISDCARRLYTPYNPKDIKQCVAVCIACERGVMTTCSTSCTLKGAR